MASRASINGVASTGEKMASARSCVGITICLVGTLACREPARPATTMARSLSSEPAGSLITVNGHRLWHRVSGSGQPLLLVPGGPGSPHDYFLPSFERLEDTFQVIYFDAHGRGQSDRANDPSEYSLTHDVEDVEALRSALGLKSMVLYGHSYGGIVAQAYALKYAHSLSHLILADTLHSAEMWQKGNNDNTNQQILNQYPEVWSKLQQLREKGATSCDPAYQELEARVPAGLFYAYNPAHAMPFDTNPDVYCRIAGPDADVVLGGDLASFDVRNRLREIRVPTLILTGRFDRVAVPRYAAQYQQFMPQAQFVMFEKSGHAPFFEEPEHHDAVVRDFVRKNAGRRSE
jgi:proline iminopeptidase